MAPEIPKENEKLEETLATMDERIAEAREASETLLETIADMRQDTGQVDEVLEELMKDADKNMLNEGEE